jgi:SLT domain-containing protein
MELLDAKDFKCWDQLMAKESNWNDSKNPVSSAEGIGQLLDGTMDNLGMKRSDAPAAQMVAALAYLGRHYGSSGACKAWAKWQKHKYW